MIIPIESSVDFDRMFAVTDRAFREQCPVYPAGQGETIQIANDTVQAAGYLGIHLATRMQGFNTLIVDRAFTDAETQVFAYTFGRPYNDQTLAVGGRRELFDRLDGRFMGAPAHLVEANVVAGMFSTRRYGRGLASTQELANIAESALQNPQNRTMSEWEINHDPVVKRLSDWFGRKQTVTR